mmetsp:Transcript_35987/g.83566  ORF Transcript_35987/g.83566 Transcript_35987/m.83566 type:complete len:215 (+) Transcript_35987:32-676(+)
MAFVPHPIVETSFDESTASRTQAAEDEADELDPPENFGMVFKGVYRSGYPTKKNFPFLEKLKLKSIIFMCEEEYADGNRAFLDRNGIKLLQHGVTGNKEPFVDINEEIIYRALQRILDVRNHPLLIHCNKGKHRTGCVVGCLRAQNHWSMTAVFDEYRSFAGTKARKADQQFIELFTRKYPKVVVPDREFTPGWLLQGASWRGLGAQQDQSDED